MLVLCGGLGPTEDDITRKAVAKTIGLETGFSEEVCQGLRAYMKSKGKTPSEDYYQKQAEVIIGAEVLKNFVGLALDFTVHLLGQTYFFYLDLLVNLTNGRKL